VATTFFCYQISMMAFGKAKHFISKGAIIYESEYCYKVIHPIYSKH